MNCFELACDFRTLALGQSVNPDLHDAIIEGLFFHRRNGYNIASDHNLLRLRAPCPHHRKIQVRAWVTGKQAADLGQRHLTSALVLNRLKDVRILQTGLVRRTARNYRDDRRVAEALGNGSADLSLRVRLPRFEVLILLRA